MAVTALLAGLVLGYPMVYGVPVVLGTVVTRNICPPHVSCPDMLSAIMWLAGLIVLVGLGIGGSRVAARWVLRPLPDMATTIEQLGPRNLGQRVRTAGMEGEVQVLADAVNGMLDRVALGFAKDSAGSRPTRRTNCAPHWPCSAR